MHPSLEGEVLKLTLILVTTAAAALAGCCGPQAPRAEKFFNQATPLDSLRGFVYAVDTHQWDYAYHCLSAASKAEISQTKFELAIRWTSDPYYHSVPIYDLISASVTEVVAIREESGRSVIKVTPTARDANGILNTFGADLIFIEDKGLWYFDFFETVSAMQGKLGAPPQDISRL